jgi:hypothetical protein
MSVVAAHSLQEEIVALIRELRNERDVDTNWPRFRDLVEANIDHISRTLSLRRLVSICDTYADYGDDLTARNATIVSVFSNMLRLAETVRLTRPYIDPAKWEQARGEPIELYDGLTTFSIDRQDTFLNMSKRTLRAVGGDPVIGPIWRTLLERLQNHDTVTGEFAENSPVKARYLPPDPTGMKDNYGR